MNLQISPSSSQPARENGGPQSGGALTDTKNALAQTARDTAAKVKAAASSTAARAKEEVERVASTKKREAADRVQHYSSAIHDSAKSLEEQDPNIAWVTHRAADKLQGVADYMRNRNFSELRHDAEAWARRHPAVFFGGVFLAGLVLGNVVKASQAKLAPEPDDGSDPSRGSPEIEENPELAVAESSAAAI